jgi:hypothetical protein
MLEPEVAARTRSERLTQQALGELEPIRAAVGFGQPDRRDGPAPRVAENVRQLPVSLELADGLFVPAEQTGGVAEIAVEPAALACVLGRSELVSSTFDSALDRRRIAGDLAKPLVPDREGLQVGELARRRGRPCSRRRGSSRAAAAAGPIGR